MLSKHVVPFFFQSIRRSLWLFILFFTLFFLAHWQLIIFFLYKNAENLPGWIMPGYTIGVAGFHFGFTGFLYLASRMFVYEMANLESLGFSRMTLISSFTSQFLLSFLLSIFTAIIISPFIHLSIFKESMGMGSWILLQLKTGILLFLPYIVFTSFFFYVNTMRDPYLMIRGKGI